jgi:iron complex outermembrane receptor protein
MRIRDLVAGTTASKVFGGRPFATGRPLPFRGPWTVLLLALGGASLAQPGLAQRPDTVTSPGALKKLTLEQLMNLDVTSVSKRPEKLSQAASAIQVITQEDIRRSGATSLPEALRLASNLEVAQLNSRQWAITARGFNSTTANKLLVLIDGRSVYTELYAGVFWDVQLVPLWDVDRIEVISGPGATLWGANAVNGVINIITKRAQDAQGLYVEGGGGTELAGTGGVRYGGAVGTNVHYRVYGTAFSRDQTDLPNGQRAADDWHMGQGGFRLDWDGSQVNQLSLQGDVYNAESAHANTTAAAFGDTASGSNLVASGTHVFSPTSDARVQLYYDRTHRNFPGTLTDDLDTYDIDFEHHIRIASRHDIVWGLGYRLVDDSVTNSGPLAFLPPHVQLAWFTGFAQDEIALIPDRLRLTIGTKVDHNDYTGVEVQPSGRLSWTPAQGGVLWAAVSRAVREPSRIDRDLFAPAQPPYLLEGGPSFQSEELLAYELGYRAQVHQTLTVSVSTFYHSYRNLRGQAAANPPAPLPIVITNGLQGTSYGAEVTVDYRITDAWRLRGGYTEMRVHVEAKPGSTDTTGAGAEAADPERWLTLRSSLDLPAHVTFDADGRYLGAIASQQVPAYAELDLRVAWQLAPTLELSVVGQDLLHSQHAEFGASTTRQEIPRSVYGLVTWHF